MGLALGVKTMPCNIPIQYNTCICLPDTDCIAPRIHQKCTINSYSASPDQYNKCTDMYWGIFCQLKIGKILNFRLCRDIFNMNFSVKHRKKIVRISGEKILTTDLIEHYYVCWYVCLAGIDVDEITFQKSHYTLTATTAQNVTILLQKMLHILWHIVAWWHHMEPQKLVIISSGNWTNDDLLSIGILGLYFTEVSTSIE